jgi:hypothetical protein
LPLTSSEQAGPPRARAARRANTCRRFIGR